MHKFSTTDPFGKRHIYQANYLAEKCLSIYIARKAWEKMDEVITDVQEIYDYVIYPEYEIGLVTGVDLGNSDEGVKIHGKTIQTETEDVILIDQSITPNKTDPMFATTLAHEIGHALLHNDIDHKLKYTPDTYPMFDDYAFNEFQADIFAKNLIAPRKFLLHRFVQLYGVWNTFIYTGPGEYTISGKKVYVHSLSAFYQKLAKPLTTYFSNVPKEYLASLMQNMRFIEDKASTPVVHDNAPSVNLISKETISELQALAREQSRRPKPPSSILRDKI